MNFPTTIYEKLFYSTVRIAVKSKVGKRYTGTASFIKVDVNERNSILFLCTCKHLVQDTIETIIFLHTMSDNSLELGNPLRVSLSNPDWIIDSENDIAILNFVPIYNHYFDQNIEIFYIANQLKDIPDSDSITQNIDWIENVYIIGYPDDKYDTVNMLPIIRTGITATPFPVDFSGKPQFLIDTPIFEGSSGSPVLICDSGSYRSKKGNIVFGNRLFFLGLVSQTFKRIEDDEYLALGIVYKSEILKVMIEEYIKKQNL